MTVVGADYDGTVAAARADADTNEDALLVQDTAWPGYEEIPAWIVVGYETLFAELDAQFLQAGAPVPVVLKNDSCTASDRMHFRGMRICLCLATLLGIFLSVEFRVRASSEGQKAQF